MPKVRENDGRWGPGGLASIESRRSYKKRWAYINHKKLRAELIAAYGPACWCCGETEQKFLTLDHLRNDGYLERKLAQNGTVLYTKLRRQGWPKDGYALACYNCNCGRAQNSGICPHKVSDASR